MNFFFNANELTSERLNARGTKPDRYEPKNMAILNIHNINDSDIDVNSVQLVDVKNIESNYFFPGRYIYSK
jgi:hypothetical protein